ncbi:MAG: DNA methyltransferase, partial [Candidatus Nanopelagicales bacterium]
MPTPGVLLPTGSGSEHQGCPTDGRLYEQLAATGYDGHESSILMTRLLFLLFGDDTGMWEKSLFTEFVETRTQPDGSDLGAQLAMLFQVLDRPLARRSSATDELIARFPYVNGGLFETRIDIPSFDTDMRTELLSCCDFDWGAISPAIFGSLFQAVKSREDRRELGEHYTTERAIMRLIGPLFLDDLCAQFEAAKSSPIRLRRLRESLGQLRFLDPACGCGNFLVVAYRELRQLELDIMVRLQRLSGDTALTLDATLDLQVSLDQFYGIELEEWPAKIAETAMFLVDHQANQALEESFGQAPERLPIEITATIHHSNALRTPWSDVLTPSDNVIVLGNPPFVGSRLASTAQKEDQAVVWAGNSRHGTLDFVTNWFKLAAEYAEGTQARVGFVSTNSITQGEQPAVLWTELWQHGMHIDFAHRTFAWASEAANAAAVHVVIIGFSGRPKPAKLSLWEYPDTKADGLVARVGNINPYLVDAPDAAVGSRQTPVTPDIPEMRFGSMPRDGGHLSNISAHEAATIRATDPIAAKYLKKIIGARELIHGDERWCLWLVDAAPSDVASSPVLRDRIGKVRTMRQRS